MAPETASALDDVCCAEFGEEIAEAVMTGGCNVAIIHAKESLPNRAKPVNCKIQAAAHHASLDAQRFR